MITQLNIHEFLEAPLPCFDVRSPSEYGEAHIIHSENLPLLDDENRKAIGICYKQQGKDAAIKLGYELVNPTREQIMENLRSYTNKKTIKLYCARGGLRSNKMAEFLDAAGYNVNVLKGGYKAYRNLAINTIVAFDQLFILSGNTGSGKTEILHELQNMGEQVLDLERLANHKGSAFGGLGENHQPSNTQFCNLIFEQLKNFNPSQRLWLESESVTIGKVRVPDELWKAMSVANGIEIVIPLEKRMEFIVNRYGTYGSEALQASMRKLSKRFGEKEIDELCEKISANDLEPVVIRLLKYYDKGYVRSRERTNCQNFVKFHLENVDPTVNSRLLLQHLQLNN